MYCPKGTVCGVSNNLDYPECQWMTDLGYCDDDGCMGFGETLYPEGIAETGDFVGMWTMSMGSGCMVAYDESGQTDLLCELDDIPQELMDATEALSLEIGRDISVEELVNRCRYFHCSTGQDPNNPLPAYLDNMEVNAINTRHVCQIGQYWDPNSIDIESGELGECQDFSECYNPDGSRDCDYDYNTEFEQWLADAVPYDTVDPGDTDCFITTGSPDYYNDKACCPIWLHGEQTSDYLDVEYFLVS